jgi:ABC-2 type transport system permease protein
VRLFRLPTLVRLFLAQARAEMQYRVSFLAELAGSFLVTALDFVALVVLLTQFKSIGGWNLAETALLYGTSSVSFGLAQLAAGALVGFDTLVARGDLDRILMRPLATIPQLMALSYPLRRLGRLVQGIVALAAALIWLQPQWNLAQILFLGVTLVGGAVFFFAILCSAATFSFWSPQTAEIANVFTYGGQFMTSYPMHIYQTWLRDLFTFVIPMAFINYYPALWLLNRDDPLGLPSWVPFLAPLVSILALMASLAFWRLGLRFYQSTGS